VRLDKLRVCRMIIFTFGLGCCRARGSIIYDVGYSNAIRESTLAVNFLSTDYIRLADFISCLVLNLL